MRMMKKWWWHEGERSVVLENTPVNDKMVE